ARHRLTFYEVATGKQTLNYGGLGAPTLAVAWSPDGGRVATGDADGRLWQFDAAAAAKREIDRLASAASAVAFGPRSLLAAGTVGGDVTVYNSESKKAVAKIATGDTVNGLAWTPDGATLV